MRTIGGDDIARALTYPALVEALEAAFRSEIEVPVRHHHRIAHPRGDATLLLMPAWTTSGVPQPSMPTQKLEYCF